MKAVLFAENSFTEAGINPKKFSAGVTPAL
jgi:hypothetical protein